MIREARRKFPGSADAFVVGDMQAPPRLGEFDLVVCLDDAINYLLGEDELEAAFAGVATMLAPEGVFAFDVNSLYTYRTAFAQTLVREQDGLLFIWRGEAAGGFESGDIATASVDVFAGRRHLRWERCSMQHVQRHHPAGAIVAALSRAGLGCKAIVGQYPGAELVDGADDEVHTKLVYFAGHQEGR
jgi:hypothetical protein